MAEINEDYVPPHFRYLRSLVKKLDSPKYWLMSALLDFRCSNGHLTTDYSRQQNYSRACDNTCDFSLVFIANFYYLMLVKNSIKPKDNDWQIFISKNCIRYEFYDTNYFECSDNFAIDCTSIVNFLYDSKYFYQKMVLQQHVSESSVIENMKFFFNVSSLMFT